MYVAVKGGEKAIAAAHALLAQERRGGPDIPELSVAQIRSQLRLAVDRVMTEGSLYDPELAALAIKQAQGDLVEAIFLLRAYRTTLPRLAYSLPLETATMRPSRRISAAFKDLPGGQLLGSTYDYTHRLLDFSLLDADHSPPPPPPAEEQALPPPCPRVADFLLRDGLTQDEVDSSAPVGDLTRESLAFPAQRDVRLQALARGDEGFVLALGYSVQRGFGSHHPFVGELRIGPVEVQLAPEELGFAVTIGEVEISECDMVSKFPGCEEVPPQFSRGYGLVFGRNERKAMAMAIVDRSLRWREFHEEPKGPAQDEEFVLLHADNVEASGFVQHLKLPHHVDFQGDLGLLRGLLRDRAAQAAEPAVTPAPCPQPQEVPAP